MIGVRPQNIKEKAFQSLILVIIIRFRSCSHTKGEIVKNLIALLISSLFVFSLFGCSNAFRSKGTPYSGYSCQESLIHYYGNCYKDKISKQEFDIKVKLCEKKLANDICEKEQADLLWCMGRVEPGTFSQSGLVCSGWYCAVGGSMADGCDCSAYTGKLKECQMKHGVFDE